MVKELKRSNEELQRFTYITSHDLQEPLRTIVSFTQLLQRRYGGQLDSDADEFMDFVVDASIRMKDMIQGLLEYSSVGTQVEEFNDFNAEESLKKALDNLKLSSTECEAEITHDALPVIYANENQISRVFQNLISNALKFRKEVSPPRIHISAQKENNEWIFSVSDNGIGMELQYTDKIFEVFRRLHTIDAYKGTGIGLAIVERIIISHGGRVWVESELGVGSNFYFTLPIMH
jgi:light-regulated signal transduction histidine kinase (bacteriophytochrome)